MAEVSIGPGVELAADITNIFGQMRIHSHRQYLLNKNISAGNIEEHLDTFIHPVRLSGMMLL